MFLETDRKISLLKNLGFPKFFIFYPLMTIFFLGFSTVTIAQEIRGTVTDENGEGVSAHVLLKKNNIPIAFEITSENGEFVFSANNRINDKDSIQLEIRKDGYQTVIEDFLYRSDKPIIFYISLAEPIIALEDIYIEAKRTPIKLKTDTTEYNASSFVDGSERVIEDLLKKLPGVRVEEDGKIKFKGQEISKLLIGGDDLFDRNYKTGSRNISIDVVDKIQAIENYSDNHLLKGIENSKKIAMNIVMKPNVVDLSGDMNLGYGFSNKYDAKMNAIFLNEKHKNFTTGSFNNIGYNYSPYNYLLNNGVRFHEDLNFLNKEQFISSGNYGLELKTQRQSINKAWFANTNHIFKPYKNLTTRLIFNYLKDRMSFKKATNDIFLLDDENLNQSTLSSMTKEPMHINPQLKFSWKANENLLIEADVEHSREEIQHFANVLQNSEYEMNSKLENSQQHTYAKLNLTHKINNNLALDVQALAANIDQQFNYLISPAPDLETDEINYDRLWQEIDKDKEFYRLKANLLGKVSETNKYVLGYTANYQSEDLISALKNDNTPLNANHLNLDHWMQEINSEYHLEWGDFVIDPSVKMVYDYIKHRQTIDSSFHKTFFQPSLGVKYKTGRFSAFFYSGTYSAKLTHIEKLYENYIIKNHRDYQRYDGNLFYLKTLQNSLGYNYNNEYNSFSAMANLFLIRDENQFFGDYQIRQNSSLLSQYFHNEATQSIGAYGMIEKLIMPIESTVRFSANYSRMETMNRVNSSENKKDFMHIWDAEFFIKSAFNFVFNFDNVFHYKQTSLEQDGNSKFKISSWINEFNSYWKFDKNLLLITTWDWHNQNKTNHHFVDFQLRYSVNEKLELSLKASNLLETDAFTQTYGSNISLSTTSQKLNERYIMLLAQFNF